MTPANLAVLIFLTAFAPHVTAQTSAQTKIPAKAALPQNFSAQQDKFIEATIRRKLAKSKIGKDGFTVRVQGGVAYWEGTTAIPQHKGAATRMAHTAGAPNVINNIKVNRAGMPAPAVRTPQATTAMPKTAPAASAATVPANTATNAAVTTTQAAAPAPTPDPGIRRAVVRPATGQNGPPQ